MQNITPCLWFDKNAEEAAKFYTSAFADVFGKINSRILSTARYSKSGAEASGQPKGSVMTVSFKLHGQEFLALNGGPLFKFSPAISLIVTCVTQKEIDGLWEKLHTGDETEQCGWVKDRFGVSWQIVPVILNQMVQDKDPAKTERVMAALMQMKKIDVQALVDAYKGKK